MDCMGLSHFIVGIADFEEVKRYSSRNVLFPHKQILGMGGLKQQSCLIKYCACVILIKHDTAALSPRPAPTSQHIHAQVPSSAVHYMHKSHGPVQHTYMHKSPTVHTTQSTGSLEAACRVLYCRQGWCLTTIVFPLFSWVKSLSVLKTTVHKSW